MKHYQSIKIVHAEPMTSTQWKTFREKLTNYSDATLKDGLEGYVVVYNPMTSAEYWSWSPKDTFEAGNKEIVKQAFTPPKFPTKFA